MTAPVQERIVLGPRSAGMLLSTEEFDAIQEYDENYVYELIHGVLIVSPIPSPEETGPNDLLGYHLYTYRVSHPEGRASTRRCRSNTCASAPADGSPIG